MHMITSMAKHTPRQEPPPYLRRRVVFELTPEELPLLEQAELERELGRLRAQHFDALFCGRCGQWVEAQEFGWQEDEGGAYAYHSFCGDHGAGLSASSRLGWRAD